MYFNLKIFQRTQKLAALAASYVCKIKAVKNKFYLAREICKTSPVFVYKRHDSCSFNTFLLKNSAFNYTLITFEFFSF